MKILIVSYYFPPIQSVACQRVASFAKYLTEFGHEVVVLTSGEEDSKVRHQDGYTVARVKVDFINWLFRSFGFLRKDLTGHKTESTTKKVIPESVFKGFWNTINDFRIRRGLGFLGRMPDVTDLWYLACRKWVRDSGEFDLVMSSYAPYSSHLIARYVRRNRVARYWIADFRDLWTEHHFFGGIFPFTLLEKRLERAVLEEADILTTISDPLKRRLIRLNPGVHAEVIYNGFEPQIVTSKPEPDFEFESDAVNLVYTGSIYPEYQDIDVVMLAIAAANQSASNQKFTLHYAGMSGRYVEASARRAGVSLYLKNYGNVSLSKSNAMQRKADVLIYLDVNIPQYDGILPTKLFEYLHAGRSLLAVAKNPTSEACSLVGLLENGSVVEGSASAIKHYLLEHDSNSKDGARSQILMSYSRRAQAELLNTHIAALTS